ncbi:hypothetical protein DA075_35550 (plasmid) [Methylobacterium currus]|uniref:Uncharacterized protein n=1 Tax=Methylobacterium currus TaxID=2051553 RepID=A0A2R4WXC6_9HYPH|nr:hypothetical protein [Methylobacterium currus]AWB26188.1 hypothetical protein DA075_35550 [Methylobacterium currus]
MTTQKPATTPKPTRAALTSLVEPKATPAAAAPAQAEMGEQVAAKPAPGPSDLKTMQVRVNRAGWVEFSRLAQDLDITLEQLMVDAMNEALRRNGKPPVMERRLPGKK